MGHTNHLVARLKRFNLKALGQARLVLYAAVVSLVLAVAGQFAPLDYAFLNLSSSLRATDASGDVVVVAIDNQTMDDIGVFPIPRRHYADMIEKLEGEGARNIYLNLVFPSKSNASDDQRLTEVLKKHPHEVNLASAIEKSGDSIVRRRSLPQFDNFASIFDSSTFRSNMGFTSSLPYATSVSGDYVSSFSTKLSGRNFRSTDSYRVDFAMRPETVPFISATDLLNNRNSVAMRGKDIIITPTSQRFGDHEIYPSTSNKLLPVIYTHLAGAETLKRGTPVDLGWTLPWAISLLAASLLVKLRSSWSIFTVFAVYALGMVGVLLLCNQRLIFLDIGAAIGFWILVAGLLIRERQRVRMEQKSFSNHVSGLPNLAALQQLSGGQPGNIVATKIHNFAEIQAVLDQNEERELVEQIARRLAYATGNAVLHQGDEGIFAWICEGEKLTVSADELDALFTLFRSPIRLKERTIDLNLTFGVDADSGREVANRLGSALTAADDARKFGERWKFINMIDRNDREWRLSLLGQLDDAIDKGEVWIAYQPKFDIRTNSISGAEALVRWRHPERGDIPPSEFIPLAEAQGRIGKLTHFVIDTAIGNLAAMNAYAPDFRISVNLSPRLLADANLPADIRSMLVQHKVDAGRLILEITETAMLSGNKDVDRALTALRTMGVHISIDDYGTGFSTLDYFRSIPATEIKIDRSFIALIEHSQSDRLMVHSTIQLAHAMDRNVVAEGVESIEQMDLLRAMECDEVQGYFTGKPQKFDTLLQNVVPITVAATR